MDMTQMQQLKEALETRRQEINDVLEDAAGVIETQISPATSGESQVDFNHPADMIAETGDPDYEKEMRLVKQHQAELDLVNHALWRMDNGTYGFCESCGNDIPFARLKAIPYTKFCIPCRESLERSARPEERRPDSPDYLV